MAGSPCGKRCFCAVWFTGQVLLAGAEPLSLWESHGSHPPKKQIFLSETLLILAVHYVKLKKIVYIIVGCFFGSGRHTKKGKNGLTKGERFLKNFVLKVAKSLVVAKNVLHLLGGTIILAIGIVLIVKQDYILIPIMYLLGAGCIVAGAVELVGWCVKRPHVFYKLMIPFGYIIIGGLVLYHVDVPLYIFTFIFGLYLFACAAVEFVNAYLVLRNRCGEFIFSLFPGIFYLTFSLLLILTPASYKYATFIILGIYCILFGLTWILDFIYSIVPMQTKQKVKRHIRISLPTVFAMFVPHAVLDDLNCFLAKEGNQLKDFENFVGTKDDAPADLEIFFHIAKKGFNSIGHCDLCFDGELIAYGNYDEAAQNRFGMGPGVLLVTNKEQYIPFCLKFNKTTIFSFGLRLNDLQKQQVRQRIAQIKSWVYPWNPPYAADREQNQARDIHCYTDFPSHLSHETQVKYYKFHQSKFKTYFVLTTNCVSLAEDITCRAGTDILGMSGIISPGTFYDYLQSEYLRKGSIVISKNVYKLPEKAN